MNGKEVILQSVRTAKNRFKALASKFEQVSSHLENCEKMLVQFIESGAYIHEYLFERVVQEVDKKAEPIETLSRGLEFLVDSTISTSMNNLNLGRKISLLEDRANMLRKQQMIHNSTTSTLDTTAMANELSAPDKERLEYADGYYVGQVKNGKRHGTGEFFHKSGNIVVGQFVEDRLEGYGEFFWTNGNIYKGEFKNFKLHGKGVMYWFNGQIYEGDFADDNNHGQGCLYLPDDSMFNGNFAKGKKHGLGVRCYSTNERYEGHYVNDIRHGPGRHYSKDGTIEERYYEMGVVKKAHKLSRTLPVPPNQLQGSQQ